ncbi:Rad17 cell cycle checkpoint protein-domain-containing protein [Dichotomocladium elegans]|nr:Rad17 cell cycle checkpoint protein-domain-containing protein [Dichotomocladium elegans]
MDHFSFIFGSSSSSSRVLTNATPFNDPTSSLWTDKYAPQDLKAIAVRAPKVKEVTEIVTGQFNSHIKLLILSGPAGCGKSTLIRLLAKEHNYPLVEWEEVMDDRGEPGYTSSMDKLAKFLREAVGYARLVVPDDRFAQISNSRKRIILLDDLPYLGSVELRERFHELILQHLQLDEPFIIVIPITESTMMSLDERMDTQLIGLNEICPPVILDHRASHLVEFNPITIATMVNRLDQIYRSERHRTPVTLNKDQLTQIAELSQGDIRHAINTLQFYCIPSCVSSLSPRPAKRQKKAITMTSESRCVETLLRSNRPMHILTELLHLYREVPLSLFHTVGKILYAKRAANGLLESKPEDILNKFSDPKNLTVFIHENYTHFFSNIHGAARAMEYLADGDYMDSQWNWMEREKFNYGNLVSMYGVMLSRAQHERTKNSFRSFKRPEYFDVMAREREKQKTIGLWNRGLRLADEPSEFTDDPIDGFSEDEFDDLYGDGSDLAGLEY